MELVTGQKGRSRIDEINLKAVTACESVLAAIAYIYDSRTLLEQCWKHSRRINLYGRYDYSAPVSSDVMKKFLGKKDPDFSLRLVPDIFHPKIIWWQGYGAYIGSANLTDSAWFQNFEAGVFMDEDELEENGIADSLREFFREVHGASHPLTKEIVEEAERWEKDTAQRVNAEAKRNFDKQRILPKLSSLLSIDRKASRQRRKDEFLTEWNDTLQTLRDLSSLVVAYKPKWIDARVPAGAQTDRFLHSYYVEQVGEGQRYPYREHFQQNRSNCAAAVIKALEWWQATPDSVAYSGEFLHEHLPKLQRGLSKKTLPTLTEDQFAELCLHIHAVHDHATRISWESLGLADKLPPMDRHERARFFGRWLYRQQSPAGLSTIETINSVLHDTPMSEAPFRIFSVCYTSEQKIRHLGLSSLGEMIGWAHPDEFPPRNGRTSKSLRALGYPVRVYGETISTDL